MKFENLNKETMTRQRFEKVIVEVDSEVFDAAAKIVNKYDARHLPIGDYYRHMGAVYHQLMLDKMSTELVEGITEEIPG